MSKTFELPDGSTIVLPHVLGYGQVVESPNGGDYVFPIRLINGDVRRMRGTRDDLEALRSQVEDAINSL